MRRPKKMGENRILPEKNTSGSGWKWWRSIKKTRRRRLKDMGMNRSLPKRIARMS